MMMLTHTKSLKIFLVLWLLHIPFAYADQKPVAQLKTFLTNTKNLTANFKQVAFDEAGKEKQTSYGVFNLSRPGKFRWNYQKPFLQEIVSNAGKVWFYDADLEQVTIKKLDKSMGSTPALLLTGDVEIEKEFSIEKQGDDEGLQWIKLVPKNPESNFKYVLIGLNEGSLAGMELNDNFGQLTRIYFSEVNTNPQFKADEFVFNIPKGVDVLEDKEDGKTATKSPEVQQETPQIENDVAVQPSSRHRHVAHAVHNHVEAAHPHEKDKAKSEDKADKGKDKAKEHDHDKDKSKSDHKDSHKDSHKEKSKDSKDDKHKEKSKETPKEKHKEKSADKGKAKHKDKDK